MSVVKDKPGRCCVSVENLESIRPSAAFFAELPPWLELYPQPFFSRFSIGKNSVNSFNVYGFILLSVALRTARTRLTFISRAVLPTEKVTNITFYIILTKKIKKLSVVVIDI